MQHSQERKNENMKIEWQPFFLRQSTEDKEKYCRLLTAMAQGSFLYSESEKPYIDYRVAEKIFCRAFSAENKSRKDMSVDAVKLKDGVGIKTFVSNSNFLKYEKIAEFVNRKKYPLNESNISETVKQVSLYRNKRIEETINAFLLEHITYHYLVRDIGTIYICECPMTPIDISSIPFSSVNWRDNIVKFHDKNFNYYFHLSKHTLFQQFSYKEKYHTLRITKTIDKELLIWAFTELSNEESFDKDKLKKYDYVILPLYSTKYGDVPQKSGLNQWNAEGRPRNPNEVYIPIPKIVHKVRHDFFPPRDTKFTLLTQDGKRFSAKVCQDNSKALMTDPNKDLGEWLLRDVLKLPERKIVTYEDLRSKNADTVIIYKIKPLRYEISLHSFGGFETEYPKNN